ncbi:Bpu10I family restriction endonuclease [Candidatus Wolfebacteria bacterium]|nr:Bpu10I family restriction endonuclease [Candidatus Wolfebacteria bacterium]
MSKPGYIHGLNIKNKRLKSGYPKILDEIENKYTNWVNATEKLSSENKKELSTKVALLNDYSDYIISVAEHFKFQDKLGSSVVEEFLFLLFRDIPGLKEDLSNDLLFMGQADAYLNLSFAPRNLQDFIKNPGIYINRKNQDFTISKKVGCIFNTNGTEEKVELIVPAVAIESKAYIPKTMFDQVAYEAMRLKEGNPFALCIIVAEQNALSNDVNLKNTKIDEVFILRKQKRSKIRKPIDPVVVNDLYNFVKSYLNADWFDNKKATERGRLITS